MPLSPNASSSRLWFSNEFMLGCLDLLWKDALQSCISPALVGHDMYD